MLYMRLNRDDILTDVIGDLIVVQHLEPKQINQRIVQKKEVFVTLWEDVAKVFASLLVHTMFLPIIIVFTSLKVKVYLVPVPQFFSLTRTSQRLTHTNQPFKGPVQLLPPSSRQMNKAEVLCTGRRVTIDELAFLDPDLYKNDTFLCNASIKRFDTRYNWWYSVYPNCVKQMQKDPTTRQLICQKHPNQIPTPWYKVNLILEDSTNEINLSLAIYTFNSSDLLIFKVSNDEAIQPITSQVLQTESTISSTTVSSSTSPTQTINQSHKQKRESMRRALFTGTGQRKRHKGTRFISKHLGQIQYSDKYFDDIYEFRHVTKLLPKNGLLCRKLFSLSGHINTTCVFPWFPVMLGKVLRFNLYNVGTKELTSPSCSEFTLNLQII
ncbi:hypothetical protein DVH24_021168 [Malus domestica]|uniref:Replication factor A C-terminal domain-containing protein n=1 Tax=Malus domestica TaxID=3750 RepID=A0A498JBC7_MALDO|nr:hypothetical protein DVH24_021168 [Malus domestica]